MKEKLTQEIVQHLFTYDPETGELRWKLAPFTRSKKGASINTKSNGYYLVRIYGKKYGVHRIIWLYVYGYFPENEIDHIDRNGINNKLSNLREVSRQCNMRNTGLSINNKSGVTGVRFNKSCNAWAAAITVNKDSYYLGIYYDFTEAACARLAAEQCLDWHKCDTNSTAYQHVKSFLEESYA